MISLVRVDNRLIHGQVVEAWLPRLKVKRVVVADDEAAANLLTNPALDPFGKIPEFKFCAVRAERVEMRTAAE